MAFPALTHPDRLLWLLLVPVVFWLARPPRPRRVLPTAHLRQWLHARKALRRRPLRHRQLRAWLLIAALALAVTAHSGPRVSGRQGTERLFVILDGSASMAARESDGGSAWDAALELLRSELAAVPATVGVRLLRLGGTAQALHGPAARELQGLQPAAGGLAVDLRSLAAAAADPATAVWTITDGQAGLPDTGALTVLGAMRDNWALRSVVPEDRWPLPALPVDVELQSHAAVPREVRVEVRGAVEPAEPVTVRLEPSASHRLRFDLVRTAAGGRLEVLLSAPGDALAADDVFAFELPPLPLPRIAVLAEAESGPAIHVAARALAAEVGGTVVEAGPGEPAAFLLVEGGEVGLAPGQGRALCFGARLPGQQAGTAWRDPAVLDWDRTDPLTAGLDLSELRVQTAWRGLLPQGKELLWAGEPGGAREPLLVLAEGPNGASLHFAFRLQDCNLPLLAAFPQLLRRSLLRAYGSSARLSPHPANPEDPAESDLRRRGGGEVRPLPAFSSSGPSLAPGFLLLGLLLLAFRAWLR